MERGDTKKYHKETAEDDRIEDMSGGILELRRAVLALKNELSSDDFALFCSTEVKGEGLRDRLTGFISPELTYGDFNRDPIGTLRNYALEKIKRLRELEDKIRKGIE